MVFEEEKIAVHASSKQNKTFPRHKYKPFSAIFYMYHSATELNVSTRIKNTNNGLRFIKVIGLFHKHILFQKFDNDANFGPRYWEKEYGDPQFFFHVCT